MSDATATEFTSSIPLVKLTPTPSRPRKKWRSALLAIRPILEFRKKGKALFGHARQSSYTSLEVRPDGDHDDGSCTGLYNFNHTGLNQIVMEKRLVDLNDSYGGVSGVAEVHQTDQARGICNTAEQMNVRRDAFGYNLYQRQRNHSFHFLWGVFKDAVILIPLGSAILSLFFGIKAHGVKDGWYDGGSILFFVFLVVAVSATSKVRLSRQFEKSSNLYNNVQIEIIRGGQHLHIAFSEIVVGDVVRIIAGDQIPADGLFLDGHSLKVDESSLTGESKPVDVDGNTNPFLLSGAMVVNGHGRMLVTSVGMNTKLSQMMSLINHDYADQRTPLQARLDGLVSFLCKAFLAIPFLALVGMVVHDLVKKHEVNGCDPKVNNLMNALSGMRGFVSVNAAVAIVVVAIPEGLPLVIINTLTYSMKRMMTTHSVTVQTLSSIETMGLVTTICIHRTGMLTWNQMEVTEFRLGEEILMNDKASSAAVGSTSHLELLQQAVILNTFAQVYNCKHSTSEILPQFYDSPTEKAIPSWAKSKLHIDASKVSITLHVESFNLEKKRSGVSVRTKSYEKMINLYWQGDAKMILGMCSGYYGRNGTTKNMDEGKRMELNKTIEDIAVKSHVCIAFAHKQIQGLEESEEGTVPHQEDCLTLLGLVGLKYPCPPAMITEVKACRDARVNVKMITEDNVLNAKAIAIASGILGTRDYDDQENPNNEAVVEGEQFENYSPEERKETVDKIRVLARSSFYHKLLLVQCLKEKGHVVAVTSDDPNDLQAVKADIGIFGDKILSN
uniref:Uncharacterized protein n=1 Tax=Nelumbo nucifera TaxID=4432 RepID=A0A822XH11_NELNU|nr:TPA_asm: hypothetical protein HUJ06_021133 [Nelumbo nucifera]